MIIGPITTVSTEITSDSNTTHLREHAAPDFVEQSEVSTTLISDHASVDSLVAQAMQTPPTHQRQMDALRTAIDKGSYTINAAEIAASILKDLS